MLTQENVIDRVEALHLNVGDWTCLSYGVLAATVSSARPTVPVTSGIVIDTAVCDFPCGHRLSHFKEIHKTTSPDPQLSKPHEVCKPMKIHVLVDESKSHSM